MITTLALSKLAGFMLSNAASGLILWFGRNDPAGKAWSAKDKIYVHGTKGFEVKPRMGVRKHTLTYYANTNFTAKIGSEVGYQIFTY